MLFVNKLSKKIGVIYIFYCIKEKSMLILKKNPKGSAIMTDKELIEISIKAQENAYVPYSKFKVGAALLCADGTVYTGCNIENATYGATNCAERTAIFKAVSEGRRDFTAVAITSSGGGLTYPCGICRQVMAEFSPSMRIILCDRNGSIVTHTLSELLPHSFTL